MKFYLFLTFFLFVIGFAEGQNLEGSMTIEEGGTGPFKAIVTSDSSLPDHTIYRPADLSEASKESKIPIILFGNGGCMSSSKPFLSFLTEIASNGYIVIAIGPYKYLSDNADMTLVRQSTKSSQLLDALDWITLKNNDQSSIYYHKFDLKKIAVMGQSCGGLQAMEVSSDSRIRTTVMLNSGILNAPVPANISGMPDLKKEVLGKLHAPIIYVIGDTSDMAYPNATDDFKRITTVPAIIVNKNVGHGGTYSEAHGGSFATTVLGWLSWQLNGNTKAAGMFLDENCELCNKNGWRIETKNF
jgi:dienelactone hydrolase